MKTYTVYLLRAPDGCPFYVGCTSRPTKREWEHKREAERGHECPKCDAIRAIWAAGGDFFWDPVHTTHDEDDGLAAEEALIALLGREYLTNETKGGRGACELGPRSQAKLDAYRQSPEGRATFADNARKAWADPQVRAQLVEAIRSHHRDPAYRAAMREQKLREWQDPDTRARHVAVRRAAHRRELSRQSMKRVASDPVAQAKARATKATPEWHERQSQIMSEALSKKWADPEYRARMTAIRQEQGRRQAAENAARRASQTDPEASQ